MSTIHLSDDGLLAFVDGTVSVDDRLRWMLHVDECRACHDLLAAAAPAVGSSPNDEPPPPGDLAPPLPAAREIAPSPEPAAPRTPASRPPSSLSAATATSGTIAGRD